jgi:hypothetical protein
MSDEISEEEYRKHLFFFAYRVLKKNLADRRPGNIKFNYSEFRHREILYYFRLYADFPDYMRYTKINRIVFLKQRLMGVVNDKSSS